MYVLRGNHLCCFGVRTESDRGVTSSRQDLLNGFRKSESIIKFKAETIVSIADLSVLFHGIKYCPFVGLLALLPLYNGIGSYKVQI
uniref:Uncharacterized protein n=1 Tax=Globodera rostochiensis TaxID=31243 RepID=A0A914HDR0_GLORO